MDLSVQEPSAPGVVRGWVLVGPTACGKSAVAQWIAERAGAVVLSADALLVYRGMDVGTAKPSADERARVPYYGLDLVAPAEESSVALYLERAREAAACARNADRPLLVVGGTGLYAKAAMQGIDAAPADPGVRARLEARLAAEGVTALLAELERVAPERRARLADPRNPRRVVRALEAALCGAPEPPAAWTRGDPVAGLRYARDRLAARVRARAERMFREGLLDEVRALLLTYPQWSRSARQAIGYAEAAAVLAGELDVDAAAERTVRRTMQLAKRQGTWFRGQMNVAWIDGDGLAGALPDARACAAAEVAAAAQAVLDTWRRHGPTRLRGLEPDA